MSKLKTWIKTFNKRKRYTTTNRNPFYDLAIPYLHGIIIDIGSSDGEFAKRFNNVISLDSNKEAITELQKQGFKAILHKVPDNLPFEDKLVSMIHCSHLVEHLTPKQLHSFMIEVDRVLCEGGIFIISTPLFSKNFYNDLSHIKPYNPTVFINYLCRKSGQRTAKQVSINFNVQDLTFRYSTENITFLGANNIVMDFIIQTIIIISKILGINRFTRTGYTLILKKNKI